MELLGGVCTVAREPGGGARVSIQLPLVRPRRVDRRVRR